MLRVSDGDLESHPDRTTSGYNLIHGRTERRLLGVPFHRADWSAHLGGGGRSLRSAAEVDEYRLAGPAHFLTESARRFKQWEETLWNVDGTAAANLGPATDPVGHDGHPPTSIDDLHFNLWVFRASPSIRIDAPGRCAHNIEEWCGYVNIFLLDWARVCRVLAEMSTVHTVATPDQILSVINSIHLMHEYVRMPRLGLGAPEGFCYTGGKLHTAYERLMRRHHAALQVPDPDGGKQLVREVRNLYALHFVQFLFARARFTELRALSILMSMTTPGQIRAYGLGVPGVVVTDGLDQDWEVEIPLLQVPDEIAVQPGLLFRPLGE